ncbi:CD99 molecule isoform 2-T2 [Aulostomus maculatus]
MKSALRTLLLLSLLIGTFCQDEFDLFDALDPAPTPEKPKEIPKAPEPPKNDDPAKPKKPTSGDSDGFGLDLEDALGPELKPKPDTPVVPPSGGGGGGGTFDDSDLFDVNDGSYKPEGGKTGGGGAGDYDSHGGADQPQEAGSGPIAGVVSAIGVALLGAASSYFAYQKKKLCFKIQGGADPESGKGHHGTQSDPQVFSNLLRTS